MKVIKAMSYADLSKKAAIVMAAQIIRNPKSVLGFATGSTPLGAYAELARMFADGAVDFSGIVSFNLDEYYGLAAAHPQSYHYYMRQNLFSHVNINPDNIRIPNGVAVDPEQECAEYEQSIQDAGGIDFQLLGIGRNGHIGFNEPGEIFTDKTHLTYLASDTLSANSRFFGPGEKMPTQAISMGIGTIMRAKSILLIASGADKADALSKMINGPVTPQMPASALQYHRDAIVMYCD